MSSCRNHIFVVRRELHGVYLACHVLLGVGLPEQKIVLLIGILNMQQQQSRLRARGRQKLPLDLVSTE